MLMDWVSSNPVKRKLLNQLATKMKRNKSSLRMRLKFLHRQGMISTESLKTAMRLQTEHVSEVVKTESDSFMKTIIDETSDLFSKRTIVRLKEEGLEIQLMSNTLVLEKSEGRIKLTW